MSDDLITIGGPLGQAFGICAHDMSPADGQVVALSFGCGAHSQIAEAAPEQPVESVREKEFEALDLGHS